jgi:hypothetical protein
VGRAGARARLVALLLLLVVWLGSGGAARAGNPDIRWRTLETEHFIIHYPAGSEAVADITARTAERAYGDLRLAFAHEVLLKTHVVLNDDTDVANGSATAIPYPRINMNITAPEALSVLEAYDDWIDILVTHELVHVVHIDTVHGLPRLLNALLGFGRLGKLTAPNIVQPRWIVEGVATFEESDDTSAGRKRSAQFDMYLRMAVLERGFPTIDQLSSNARVWPHGTSVYLYGLHLFAYIAERYGQRTIRELSHVYARQLIPYGIHRAIREVIGVDFHRLWADFRADTTRKIAALERRIRARGLRQGRRVTFGGELVRYPLWSADDRELLAYRSDGHTRGGVYRVPASGARVREGWGIGREGADVDVTRVLEVLDPSSASFIGATQELVVDQLGVHDLRYRWSDLYRWRGGDPRALEQLTFGRRASEPHVSPDGTTVVFRRNDLAQSRLGFLALDTLEVTEVAPSERLEQVYTPRWAPDGDRVAFSGWREGGYRDIYVYRRSTGETERITADRFLDVSPAWTPDGRYLLFSSDRDDVFNLYAWDVEARTLHQVSNVLGGAFEPAVSHDGAQIAYVGYSARGFDLWVMPLDPQAFLVPLPATDELPPMRTPRPLLPSEVAAGESDQGPPPSATRAARPYVAGRTFFPRTIMPSALEFQSSAFGNDLGVALQVQDVLALHTLTGAFTYLLAFDQPVGSVSYTWDRLLPTLSVGFGRGYAIRGDGFERYEVSPDAAVGVRRIGYREATTRVEASASVPLVRHARHGVGASARYRWSRYENLDEADLRSDPTLPLPNVPEVGDEGELSLSLAYENREGARFSFNSDTGARIGLSAAVIDPVLGSDWRELRLGASWIQLLQMPWRGHQVLAFRLGWGASARGRVRQTTRTPRLPYTIGGLAEDQDVVRALLSRTPFGTGGALRGYRPGQFAGSSFGVLNAEYRIPLVDVDRGIGTLPFMLRRIALIPFTDVGAATTTALRAWRDLRVGAGASLVFSLRLGYLENIDLFVEYAHGFDRELGLDSVRAVVARTF